MNQTIMALLQELYDYNRIPLWIINQDGNIEASFFSDCLKNKLSLHIKGLLPKSTSPSFDLLCFSHELYAVFSFKQGGTPYYLLGGPMLLSIFYQKSDMKKLSFSTYFPIDELVSLVENLPVISFSSFCSCLRIMMLLLNQPPKSVEDISNYKFSDLEGNLTRTYVHELFENREEYRIHTPYQQELSILHCVRDGNVSRLESTYRTLPETKYGTMSKDPFRQLLYGCIANTTLVTRYAIEGGLEEESAFTLSDVYIQKMERCKTLYELQTLNEKMAIDFTTRVSKATQNKHPHYSRQIEQCITLISKHIYEKITLESLANEICLTPKYLSFLFQKETGKPLHSFIEEKKIEEGKNLLLFTAYSYSHISNLLCFCSQSHFIQVFKRQVGMTPKEYRNQK
ncbi:MAG: hypothetical protein PWP24_1353 [Clostridiales bacterium]|nr:hypothetical protein [Clostridiales bacterium]